MNTTRPKAVLIDCFGTLVHCPWPAIRRNMAERAGLRADRFLQGYALTRQDRNTGIYPDAAAELAAVCAAANLSLTDRQVRDLARFECELLKTHGDYYPDAIRFLERVRASGLAIGLLSNCSPSAASLLDRLQPHRYLDEVILSFQIGCRKPDERAYLTALQRLGEADPGQCLFVDDDAKFCAGAESIGMPAILLVRNRDPIGAGVQTLDDILMTTADVDP